MFIVKIIESSASPKQLNTTITFAKGAVQASLSRSAVEWLIDSANLTTILAQFNDQVWLTTFLFSDYGLHFLISPPFGAFILNLPEHTFQNTND